MTERPRIADYAALFKPRVMSLVTFTAIVGWIAAPGDRQLVDALASIIAIAAGGGAAGALNMWFDADIDARMERTRARPIPAGRMPRGIVLTIGLAVAAAAVLILGLAGSPLAAALLLFTIGFYVVIYTMWLKRSTPYSVVIGGLAGALPPAIAWAAKTGSLSIDPLLMVGLILAWTPPHSWALVLMRHGDYANAQVPSLSVTHGTAVTRRQILLYSLLLVPISLSPGLTCLGGIAYLTVAGIASGLFLLFAIRLRMATDVNEAAAARRLFLFSLIYLFLLFAALGAEHLLQTR